MSYFEEFKVAHEKTLSFGLDAPDITKFRKSPWFVNKKSMATLAKRQPFRNPEQLMAQCNLATAYILEIVRDVFRCDAYLTIGYIESGNEVLFAMSDESVADDLASGRAGRLPQGKHHAWITLETCEIVDMTLGTSFAMINQTLGASERAALRGAVISGDPDKLNGMRYIPWLVGEHFYFASDTRYRALRENYFDLMKSANPVSSFVAFDRNGAPLYYSTGPSHS